MGVLSVAKLTPGQEGYYERSVAAGLDDYYAGRGESPGVWTGRAPRELGLEGVVEEGELGAADPRRPPAHRASSCAAPPEGADDHGRADRPAHAASGALETEEARARSPASTSSSRVPKSVSLLHALGDEETRRAVNEAHPPPGRRRSPTSRTRRASSAAARSGVAPRARRRASSRPPTSTARPGAGPAPAHARDRRQHGADARATASGGRSTARRSSRPTGSPPATSTRPTCAPSSPARSASSGRRRTRAWPSSGGVPREVIGEFSTRRAQVVEHMDERGDERLLRRPGRGGRDARAQGARRPRRGCARTGAPAPPSTASARASSTRAARARPAAEPSSRRAARDRPAAARPERADREARPPSPIPTLVMAWAEAHAQGATAERVRRLAARLAGTDGVEPVGEAAAARAGRPATRPPSCSRSSEPRSRSSSAAATPTRRPFPPSARRDRAPADRHALRRAGARWCARSRPSPEPRRLRRRARRRGQDDRHPRRRTGLRAAPASRCSAPRRRASPPRSSRTRPASPRRPSTGSSQQPLAASGCARLVVDEAGMAETRILAPLLERVEQAQAKVDPDRRPAPAARRRRRRPLRRHRRAPRRRRAQREPPPARRAASGDALASDPRRPRPRLPRLRREARAARRLRERRSTTRRRACSPTGGSTPATTSPATSCSRSAAATSPSSTSSPAR